MRAKPGLSEGENIQFLRYYQVCDTQELNQVRPGAEDASHITVALTLPINQHHMPSELPGLLGLLECQALYDCMK